MADNNSSSVASVAIVLLVLIALFAAYLVFSRGVSAHRNIDVDINVPRQVNPK